MLRAALYTADPWDSALAQIRVRQPAAAAGVEMLQGYHDEQVDASLVEQVDLVIIQRDFPRFPASPEVIQRARAHGKPVIYETDDWLLDVPPANLQSGAYQACLNGMLWAILQADRVVTCNSVLAYKLSLVHPDVRIFENYLVDAWWPLQPPQENSTGPLRVGYMGGATHQRDLDWLAPVLADLLAQFPGQLELVFWGCPPPESLHDQAGVTWHDVRLGNYQEFSRYFIQQRCDIALAPLIVDEFNRAKSPLKYLEYSALGAPGVYSAIEPYQRVVVDGENGLLAANQAEWRVQIERLVRSPELRLALTREAQARLQRDWLLNAHAAAWLAAASTPGKAPATWPLQAVLAPPAKRTQQHVWELEASLRATGGELVETRNHLEGVLASNTWKLAQRIQKLVSLFRPGRKPGL
jgi:glycosyltransferase involved in cell wall biosynthesis